MISASREIRTRQLILSLVDYRENQLDLQIHVHDDIFLGLLTNYALLMTPAFATIICLRAVSSSCCWNLRLASWTACSSSCDS